MSAAAAPAAWRAFVAAPVRCVARGWLHDCLGGVADDALLAAMVGHPRFQARLTQLLIQRYALPLPETLPVPEEADARLLSLPPEAGAALAHYCGVIGHADAFVREIRAPRVVALKQRVGEAAFAAALAHRALALPAVHHDDDEALARAVRRDGAACLQAWLARQSPGLVAWLRLGLARETAEAAVTAEIAQRGPHIVRCAAALLAAAEPSTADPSATEPSTTDPSIMDPSTTDQGEPDDARTAGPSGQGHPA